MSEDSIIRPAPQEDFKKTKEGSLARLQDELSSVDNELAELDKELAALDQVQQTKQREAETEEGKLQIEISRLLQERRTILRDIETEKIPSEKGRSEIARIDKELDTLEISLDKKLNPFRHYLMGKMRDNIFQAVFGEKRETISMANVAEVLGSDSEDIKIIDTPRIVPERLNAVKVSGNGFLLVLENKTEVSEQEGGNTYYNVESPRAKYRIVGPDSTTYDNELNLSWQEGVAMLEKNARDYQAIQRGLFRGENK